MTQPIIGIPGNQMTHLSPEYQGLPITYTPQGFIAGIQAAWGLPVILPINDPSLAEEYIDRIDGLLLAGGQDVSPLLYGEEPGLKLGATNPERDLFEIALIKEAVKKEKPILAVCRGMQLLNVAYGGTLYQDVTDNPDFTVQHVQRIFSGTAAHTIDIDPSSRLGAIYGETYVVNSYHHQAVKQLADPFKAVAWSKDNLIEAYEAKDPDTSIVAVQWHPELMAPNEEKMQILFKEFVSRVKKSIAPAL